MTSSGHRALFNAEFPIIMAPMFLISNVNMVVEALESGITAAFPALNYRSDAELAQAIDQIRQKTAKPFGVNLIVNQSNLKLDGQLKVCLEKKVDFVITSLGNPQKTIEQCHKAGIKVFCDVVDLKYALKVEAQGADAVIAVNAEAGGHAGNISGRELIPLLAKSLSIPVISAGGVSTPEHIKTALSLGASAVSVGTIFIASKEAPVSNEYKEALVQYGARDIVRTTKMSGSALTVINTPYVQSIGTEATWIEKLLNRNKKLRKYFKLLLAFKGIKTIKNAAQNATYKTIWVAGPAIEDIHAVEPVRKIVERLTRGLT